MKDRATSAVSIGRRVSPKCRLAEAARRPLDRARLDAEIARQQYEKFPIAAADTGMILQQSPTLELLVPRRSRRNGVPRLC